MILSYATQTSGVRVDIPTRWYSDCLFRIIILILILWGGVGSF